MFRVNNENAPWWEKSIGRGIVHQAGADFLLKCALYTVSTRDRRRRTEKSVCYNNKEEKTYGNSFDTPIYRI